MTAWKRAVLCWLLPGVVVLLAAGGPCSAFSVEIIAPSVGPVEVEPGEEVKFEAIATDDWGQDLTGRTKWLWDFGDGTTSNQNPAWHVFGPGGPFTVTVTGRCDGEQAGDVVITAFEGQGNWVIVATIINDPEDDEDDIQVEDEGEVCHACWLEAKYDGDPQDEEGWGIEGIEWFRNGREVEDPWGQVKLDWETFDEHNEGVKWSARLHLVHVDEFGEPDDEDVVTTEEATFTVNNTVVSGDNDVLLWTPEAPDDNRLTIDWTIGHRVLPELGFDVKIEICDLSGASYAR